MGRDIQAKAVYKAEKLIREIYGMNSFNLSFDEIEYILSKILNDEWFINKFGLVESVGIFWDNTDEGAYSILNDEGYSMSLPPWSRNPLSILHELTHIALWKKKAVAHGPKFTKGYLELVNKYIGEEEAKDLYHSFMIFNVKVGK